MESRLVFRQEHQPVDACLRSAFNREFEKYGHILRHETTGGDKVIRHLSYLAGKHPRSRTLAAALGYFRHRRHRMRYATFARQLDRTGRLLAATYVHDVRLPDNVVDLASRRPR
jgi:hypothetical protein